MVTFRMNSDELDSVVVMHMPAFLQKVMVTMHVVLLCKLFSTMKLGTRKEIHAMMQ